VNKHKLFHLCFFPVLLTIDYRDFISVFENETTALELSILQLKIYNPHWYIHLSAIFHQFLWFKAIDPVVHSKTLLQWFSRNQIETSFLHLQTVSNYLPF